jgi:hypothetical protein
MHTQVRSAPHQVPRTTRRTPIIDAQVQMQRVVRALHSVAPTRTALQISQLRGAWPPPALSAVGCLTYRCSTRTTAVWRALYRDLLRARLSCELIGVEALSPESRRQLAELARHIGSAAEEAATRLATRHRNQVTAGLLAPDELPAGGSAQLETSLLAAAEQLVQVRATSPGRRVSDQICLELLEAVALLPIEPPM